MEALGFGTILLLVAVVLYFGLLRPVETGARILDKEMQKLEDEQTVRHDQWYVENQLDNEAIAKADASRAYYSKRRKL